MEFKQYKKFKKNEIVIENKIIK